MAGKESKAGDSAEVVTVKSALEGRVGLWERDDAHKAAGHKDGEVFVKDTPIRVARTAAVNAALASERLVRAEGEEKPSEKKAEK
jgi:hypothetical protein